MLQIYDQKQTAIITEKIFSDITATVLGALDGVQSIVIYGSLGRNEAAWVDGIISPKNIYNDIDILVIRDNTYASAAEIAELSAQLKSQFAVRWIDLTVLTMDKFKRMRRDTQYFFDLIHGSTVIYGDAPSAILDLNALPAMQVRAQIRRLFFTRLFCLFGPLKIKDGMINWQEMDLVFFHNQLSKAVFAIAQANTLYHGDYTASYSGVFNRYYKRNEASLSDVEWRLLIKIAEGKFTPSSHFDADLFQAWLLVTKLYVACFVQYLNINGTRYIDVYAGTKFDLFYIVRRVWHCMRGSKKLAANRELDYDQCRYLDRYLTLAASDGTKFKLDTSTVEAIEKIKRDRAFE